MVSVVVKEFLVAISKRNLIFNSHDMQKLTKEKITVQKIRRHFSLH